MQKSKTSYREQWRRYRLFQILAVLAFVSFIPTSQYALPWLKAKGYISSVNPVASWPAYVVMMIPGGLFVFFFDRVLNWRCPRCQKSFFAKKWYSDVSVRNCVHCGLPKFDRGS